MSENDSINTDVDSEPPSMEEESVSGISDLADGQFECNNDNDSDSDYYDALENCVQAERNVITIERRQQCYIM